MLRASSISLVARVLQSSRAAQSPAFASVARGFATESTGTTFTKPVRVTKKPRARAVAEEEDMPPPPPPFEDDMDAISSIDFVDPKEAVVPTREPPASYLAKAQKAHTPSYSRSSSAPYSSSSYKSSSSRSSSDGGNSHVFATLEDVPLPVTDGSTDWARSFQGIGSAAYPPEIAEILSQELEPDWIEIKPDGILYLPEIHYRRILNKAFGPGGWGLVPRSETVVSPKTVSREFGLVCHGRLVSIARGEQIYFDAEGVPTASEGCKSNAMMRCCKDLGVASELWDPRFIRRFKKTYCDEAFVEHISTKRKKKMWKRKDVNWEYPYRSASF